MNLPVQHHTMLHSTNLIERPNSEIKRRLKVIGTFPNEDAVFRRIGAVLPGESNERAVRRAGYTALETIARLHGYLAVSLPPTGA